MTPKITDLVSDSSILTQLAKKRNIAPLEFILSQELKHLKEICKTPLDFGPLVQASELETLLDNAIPQIHEIFEIDNKTNENLKKPKIKNFNLFDLTNPVARNVLKNYTIGTLSLTLAGISVALFFTPAGIFALPPLTLGCLLGRHQILKAVNFRKYNQNSYYSHPYKTIIIELDDLEITRTSIAHEYTHFLEYEFMKSYTSAHRGLMEGIARGIERLCANKIYKKEENIPILLAPHNRTYGELKSTYKWLCDITRTKIKKELILFPSAVDEYENENLKELNHPSQYASGNTFICLAELNKGLIIYPELLRNNYEVVLDDLFR